MRALLTSLLGRLTKGKGDRRPGSKYIRRILAPSGKYRYVYTNPVRHVRRDGQPEITPQRRPVASLRQVLRYHEDRIRKRRMEHLVAIGKDGTVVAREVGGIEPATGDEHVNLRERDVAVIRARGDVTTTHNHTTPACLSPEDLASAAHMNVAEERVVWPNGDVVRCRRPEGGWPEPRALYRKLKTAYKSAVEAVEAGTERRMALDVMATMNIACGALDPPLSLEYVASPRNANVAREVDRDHSGVARQGGDRAPGLDHAGADYPGGAAARGHVRPGRDRPGTVPARIQVRRAQADPEPPVTKGLTQPPSLLAMFHRGIALAQAQQALAKGTKPPTRNDVVKAAGDAARSEADAMALAILSVTVPGTTIDPWLYALVMAEVMHDAEPEDRPAMREWPLSQWTTAVTLKLDEFAAEASHAASSEPPDPEPVTLRPEPFPALPAPSPDAASTTADTVVAAVPPLPPEPPTPPDGPTGEPGPFDGILEDPPDLPIPSPPPGLPDELRDAWIQARTRAGIYARGLGNYVTDDAKQVVGEVWDGEVIESEADAEQRQAGVRIIGEEVAAGIANGLTADKVASNLANRTGDWSRNWERIARTEMQGAHNEGIALAAVRDWGEEARVARLPNADACPVCRRLFLEPDGTPRVFRVVDIVANGVNVGRRPADMKASLWPTHPFCCCTTESLPPGTTFNHRWELVSA